MPPTHVIYYGISTAFKVSCRIYQTIKENVCSAGAVIDSIYGGCDTLNITCMLFMLESDASYLSYTSV